MLHLLLSGGTQLQDTQNSHQHKEDDGFCLSHAAAACAGVEGVDDIQRQHFGGLNDLAALLDKGSAGGQRQVLVVQLKGIGQGQEGADGNGGHHIGNGNLPQRLPAVGAINACRLQHILRYALQPCHINDHHVTDLLPAHQYDQAPEAVFGLQYHAGAVFDQNTIEDHAPDVAQHNTADEVRHKEYRAEQVGAADSSGQRIGNRKGDDIDEHQRNHGKQCRVPEGMAEALILESGDVVFDAHPCPVLGGLKIAEGKEKPLAEWIQKTDAECREGRQQEQPKALLDRSPDQR